MIGIDQSIQILMNKQDDHLRNNILNFSNNDDETQYLENNSVRQAKQYQNIELQEKDFKASHLHNNVEVIRELKKQRQHQLSQQIPSLENLQDKLPIEVPIQMKQKIQTSKTVGQQQISHIIQQNQILKVEKNQQSSINYELDNKIIPLQGPAVQYLLAEQIFTNFSTNLKGKSICLEEDGKNARQDGKYYENQKLILTQPIKSLVAHAQFRVQNLKYCLGFGIALKQVIENHDFNYKSYENELSHGLYIVTSQGYAWSHHLKQEDDSFHEGFKHMYNGCVIKLKYSLGKISFTFKKDSFELQIPELVTKKYTLCFCAYLHEKGDEVKFVQ